MPSKSNLEKISRWLSIWKPRLLLDKWAVIPRLEDKSPAMKNGKRDMAEITIDPSNSEAWLAVYPRVWDESKEYQEMVIVHELAHLHTEPIRQLLLTAVKAGTLTKEEVLDSVEDLTNSIAKVVYVSYRKSKTLEYHL